MKRFFFCILACMALLACKKETSDEPTPTPEPTPVKTYKAEFIIAATNEQVQCIEFTYEFSVDGKSVTVKESEMKEFTDVSKYPKLKKVADTFSEFESGSGEYKFYTGELGTLQSGSTVTGVKKTGTAKTSRPAIKELNLIVVNGILIDGVEASADLSESEKHAGISNTDDNINKWLDLTNKKKFSFSYTKR